MLLSSIEGAAVTAVKIEGVLHEFSPIQGVVEDATDIILNLKQIPLKVYSDQPKTLTVATCASGSRISTSASVTMSRARTSPALVARSTSVFG